MLGKTITALSHPSRDIRSSMGAVSRRSASSWNMKTTFVLAMSRPEKSSGWMTKIGQFLRVAMKTCSANGEIYSSF